MQIDIYKNADQQKVIDLILNIQQNEFKVPVTMKDQPDLLDVENFYQQKNGNFWVVMEEELLIGTIALIDMENNQACLRKMFVHKDWRGKEKGVGQFLLDTLIEWCSKKDIKEIYLGTLDKLLAARKFYQKNGFIQIPKSGLPENFPVMEVDNLFLKLIISQPAKG